jgi:acyl-CoA thioester hydrolase
MEELLEGYAVVIETPVAWGEMDSLGHVNNIVYFRYFESARMAYFGEVGFWNHMEETGVGPILASTQCRFRLPLEYPDTVSIGARSRDIGDDRFVMEYIVVSHRHRKVAAEGSGLIVVYDYRAKRKAPLPDEIRRRIEAIESKVSKTE